MSGRVKPLEKFTQAVGKCSVEVCHSPLDLHTVMEAYHQQGAVYGKCVAAEYQNVRKDGCAQEFMKLKNCYLVL